MAVLAACIKQFTVACSSTSSSTFDSYLRKVTSCKLSEKSVALICDPASASSAPTDVCLLCQYEEQLRDLKSELACVSNNVITMDDTDSLSESLATLEKEMFDCGLKIKKLLASSHSSIDPTPASTDSKGVKLPKLDVPTFDGQVINWRSFWEQFEVSVYIRSSLSDLEKLMYLSQAQGTAMSVIEGVLHSGNHYMEAVESLKAHYDHPRLLHQTHVCMILDTASLE